MSQSDVPGDLARRSRHLAFGRAAVTLMQADGGNKGGVGVSGEGAELISASALTILRQLD